MFGRKKQILVLKRAVEHLAERLDILEQNERVKPFFEEAKKLGLYVKRLSTNEFGVYNRHDFCMHETELTEARLENFLNEYKAKLYDQLKAKKK